MSLTFYLLAFAVTLALFSSKAILVYASLVLVNTAAFYQGILNSTGLSYLLALLLMLVAFYYLQNKYATIRDGLFILIAILLGAFILHYVPGFANKLVLNKVHVSQASRSYTMYLNFDKIMAALLVYTCSPYLQIKRNWNIKTITITCLVLLVAIAVILLPAVTVGVIKYDPKIPNYLPIWALNNLLFVCFSEEVIFRGFLQQGITNRLPNKPKYAWLAIILAAVLFGLYHYKSGVLFVGVSAIAGLFYGYAFYRTKNILSTILVHFGLNLTHILFFTYPS